MRGISKFLVTFAGKKYVEMKRRLVFLCYIMAWGHYWSWDPKETWAAITWLAYLVYVHYRNLPHHRERIALWMLIVTFVLLQMCWWGINYLPSAQGSSVHTYNA